MNKVAKSVVLPLAAVGFIAVLPPSDEPKDDVTNIRWVDIDKVLNSCELFKASFEKHKQRWYGKEKELSGLNDEVQALRKELELTPDPSSPQMQEKALEFKLKTHEFQTKAEHYEKVSTGEQVKALVSYYGAIEKACREYSMKNGISAIFKFSKPNPKEDMTLAKTYDFIQAKMDVYVDPALDVSLEIARWIDGGKK